MATWQIFDYLSDDNDLLQMDGLDLVTLGERYGTPLFVFSERRIRHNAEAVRAAFQNKSVTTQVFYASKANSNLAVLEILRDAGLNIEVNSGGELYKAIKIGFRPDQIIFNGVAKTEAEICEAIKYQIFSINVDSPYELQRILEVARSLRMLARITLRMVPEIKTGSYGGLQTGTHETKFGISENELSECYREVLAHPDYLALVGLHMHIGSQTHITAKYKSGFQVLLNKVAELYKETGFLVPFLNIGGGLPVPYIKLGQEYLRQEIHSHTTGNTLGDVYSILSANASPEDIAKVTVGLLEKDEFWDSMDVETRELRKSLTKLCVVIEPGRYIVADTAVLISAVQNFKVRPHTGDTWLMLDAGFNTLIDSFDYNWYFHTVSANKPASTNLRPYKLAGPLCDSGDEFCDSEKLHRQPDYRMLPEQMKPGDLIAFLDTGAYTLEQMSQYNGQCRAAAVMIRQNGNVQIIRKRDSYEDLVSQDVSIRIDSQ